MKTRTLRIQGMSCSHCVRALRKELEKIRDLTVDSVEIGKAVVSFNGEEIDDAALEKAVEEAGFRLVA
ncbi:MAG TPA: heavy-metal-associated domain-containing protein [Deltaproteobacteria bacterium]|nr:heavy-metal-associated domain-containing protein [Deltaproteobacteria bacterium]